jgi:hypothetical protein
MEKPTVAEQKLINKLVYAKYAEGLPSKLAWVMHEVNGDLYVGFTFKYEDRVAVGDKTAAADREEES